MALAYAKDSTEMPGGIARLFAMPTADNKGEIAELKSLYDSIYTTESSAAIPSSFVVGAPLKVGELQSNLDSSAIQRQK